MKKRTNEEKRQLIDDACELFAEAAETIKRAKVLFHLCGIEFCEGFNEKEVPEWSTSGSNLQIYTGTKKLCDIVGVESRIETGFCYTEYKGLKFVQVGQGKNTNTKYYFR